MAENIDMPVECIGPVCVNCPELEIGVDKMIDYNGCEEVGHENKLKCVHEARCRRIYYLMQMDRVANRIRDI